MEDELALLQGKLSEVSVQLENFVPSAQAASQLKSELESILTMLDSMRFCSQPSLN